MQPQCSDGWMGGLVLMLRPPCVRMSVKCTFVIFLRTFDDGGRYCRYCSDGGKLLELLHLQVGIGVGCSSGAYRRPGLQHECSFLSELVDSSGLGEAGEH